MQGRINDPSIFERVLSNISPHTACERKKRLKLYGTHDDAGIVEQRVVLLTLEFEMISSQIPPSNRRILTLVELQLLVLLLRMHTRNCRNR